MTAESTILAQTRIAANDAANAAAAAEAAAQSTVGKAPLASPAFTGNPTAPTPTDESNNSSLATTQYIDRLRGAPGGVATLDNTGKLTAAQLPSFSVTSVYTVASQAAMLALPASVGNEAIRTDIGNALFILTTLPASTLANWTEIGTSPVLSVAGLTGAISASDLTAELIDFTGDSGSGGTSGDVPAPTAGQGAHSFLKASGGFVQPAAADLSDTKTGTGNLVLADSPTLTGTPLVPTATVDTNTGQAASTQFVLGQASASGDGLPSMDGAAARGTSTHFARADHVHPTDTSRAPLSSPAFTGAPTAPDPTTSSGIATKNYVDSSGGIPSGTVVFTILSAAPAGWLLFADQTIGNVSSGATYANALAQTIFTALYAFSDANCPLLTSAGSATTRSAQGSAATAWAANCRMTMPKTLGRALAVAGSGSGLSARAPGDAVGQETVSLTAAQQASMPVALSLSVDVTPTGSGSGVCIDNSTHDLTVVSGNVPLYTLPVNGSATATGGGGAHTNMEPTSFLSAMIKL